MAKRRRWGRWKNSKQLGQGGQSETFEVFESPDSTSHVLKRFRNRRHIERFKREIKAIDAIVCPGVAKIVEHDLTADKPWYVVPYLGEDLAVAAQHRDWTIFEKLSIYHSIVSTVSCIHSHGLVHRDIKPNNIVIDAENKAHIIDFGICQFVDGNLMTLTRDENLGNINFMAPEAMAGSIDMTSPSSDVYSLGKLFVWLMNNGQLVARENFPRDMSTSNDQQLLDFQWYRRICAATIIEDSSRRISSGELLDLVDMAISSHIDSLSLQANGKLLLADYIGDVATFHSTGVAGITSPPKGNPPGDEDIAISFVIPDGCSLSSVSATFVFYGQADISTVTGLVLEDVASVPDPERPVSEEFKSVLGPGKNIISHSITFSRLLGPGKYWISFSVDEANRYVGLYAGPRHMKPSKWEIAVRRDGKEWSVRGSDSGEGHAYRLVGLIAELLST